MLRIKKFLICTRALQDNDHGCVDDFMGTWGAVVSGLLTMIVVVVRGVLPLRPGWRVSRSFMFLPDFGFDAGFDAGA